MAPKRDKGIAVGDDGYTYSPVGDAYFDYHDIPENTNASRNAGGKGKSLAMLMAEDLVPLAIRHVAGAIMLFWQKTHPPTVNITSPVNNEILSGTVSINTTATDDWGISSVEFYLDNSLIQRDSTDPYTYNWDTISTKVVNGTHSIKAIAYNKANQPSNSHTITVTVSNPTGTGNNAPNKPTALYQYKSDGVTGMAAGDTTNERTVVMKGNVTDPDNDAVSLDVEVKPVGTAFSNAASSNCVSGGLVSSGGTAVVTCSGLADGQYKWQARAKDNKGAVGAWASAGGNLETSADFIVSAGSTNVNYPPSVTAIYPNGGETLTVGSPYDIKWNASDSTGTITKIEIYASQDGGVTWSSSPIHSNTSNTGLFTWMPSATTTQGRIKVVATDSYGVAGSDLSDGNFSVVSSCTKPSVPEFYSIGLLSESGSYTVSWSNVYGAGNYTLQEATNSSFTSPIEYSSIAQPPKSISGKTTNTYYYRVRADNSCGSSDWSNIVYIPVVINQPPNVPSNPSLVDGTTNVPRQPTLSWSGGDTDGTVEYAVKFGTEPNPGFYAGFGSISGTSYQIPYILEPGTTYYWGIKSRDSKGLETEGPIWRFTTAYSYADLVPTNLTVTGDIAPNVQVNLDLTVKNQGTYTAPGAQVFFYLSSTSGGKEQKLNNGTSIPQLAPGQETTISQTVTLSNLKAGQSYIDAWIDTQNYFTEGDLGNNTLSYVINYLDSNAPGISSLWFAWSLLKVRTGHEYSIAWNVADDIGVTKMDFYYSTDNGTNWKTIATGFVPESSWSNSYSWTVPSDAPLTDQLKIKMVAWDGSGNSGEATAGPYTVISGVAPTVTLLSPNGGEVWDLGSTQTIKWSVDAPNGIGNMVLYLYYGDKVEYIANITANTSGVYSWTMPSSAHYVSNNAKVKISVEDQNGNASYDFSDGYFTISDPSAPPPAPWNTPLTISSGECSGEPKIASDSTGNIHLVCQGASSILYRKFDGTAWVSMPAVYNFDASAYSVEQIGLSIDSNGYPHVVWKRGMANSGGIITDLNQLDIFYSDFNGTAWSSPLNLSDNIPGAPSLTSLAWSTRTAMPLGNSSAASAVVNEKIYVFGGSQTVTNYAYDTGTDSWSQIADSPFGVHYGGAAVINNKVYVFGSIGGYNGLQVYDPISNSWTVLTSSPNAGRFAGVTAVNGKLYVIGGADGNLTPFNTVQEYDPSANSWAVKVGMPTARYGAGTVSFNNLIYVFGGRGSGGTGFRQVEVYDPATDTWTSKAQMSSGVESYPAVAVVNNKIYLLGGLDLYSNAVYEYDPSTDWWLTKTSMPTARFLSSYGAVGNAIYVIGGNGGGQDLSVNEQVTVTSAGSATVSQDPSVAVDAANNTHIAWGDGYSFNSDYSRSGQANVYYRKKDSAGNWSGVTQLTIGGGSAPEIVSDHNGRLHMSYELYSICSCIGHMMWDGLSWSSPVTVSTAYSGLMDISVDNGNRPHLVWWYYDAIAGEQQIFYSGHDGAGWSVAEKISSSSDGRPFVPYIGIDSDGRPHVIYEDFQGGNLLYRFKGTTGWSSPVQLNLDSQYVSNYSGDLAITPNNWAYTIWMASSGGSTALFYNFANISGISSDSTPPSVSVTSPSGGETISNGALYEILWSALDNGTISSVSIEYSSDGGNTYNLIASNEPNDGAYQWTVPNINSSNVIVRVSAVDYGGNQGIGYSGLFSISDKTTPAVTVLAPNGGEALTPGGVQMITWTATDNSGVSYVDIFYSNDGGSSWSSIASAQPNTGSFAWTVPYDISSNCRVKVVAYDTAGLMGEDASDAAFAVAYANAPPVAPFSPSPLDGETNVQLGAVLGWSGVDPDADALTYSVYFGTAVDPAIVATGLLVPVYTPGSLTPNTTYYWKADATDGYSTTVGTIWSFTTGAEAISAPTALGATVQSASQVSLVWMDSASNETQYSVERKSGVDGAYAEIAVLPADAISYVDSGLKGNTVYIYRIRASGGTAVSAYSNEAAATTANNLPNTPSSPVPANGVNGQSAAQILSWNGGDPDYSDTVTYDVYFGTSSNPPLISSGQSEAYFSPGILSLGSVYYWRVVATDSHGGVTESPVWYFVLDTFDTTPPADGTLSATALNTVVDLSWFGFSDSGSGISGYKLVYDTAGTPASCAGTPLYAGADTSYSHTKLTNGISYGYRVCAIDNAGNTSSGITATGTPVAPDRLSMPLDDSGILGVERDDGGSDSNNIDSATSNPRLDIAFNFGITLRDPSGNAPQYVRLYITNRSNPGTTDYYPVDLTCDTNWAYGAYCSYPTLLGPAANHKYYFEAKLADGTVLRYPATGEIAGPTVELLNGQNMVGVPRDLATADLDGSAAFGNAQTYKWVSEGITTDGNKGSYVLVDSSNPVKPGDGYFTVRNGGSATLPELELFNDVLDSTYSVTMKPGWNMISNPYGGNIKLDAVQVQKGSDAPVSWLDAATNGWVVNAIYFYKGSDWGSAYTFESAGGSPDATLVPWMGYWVYLNKNDGGYSLVIPRP